MQEQISFYLEKNNTLFMSDVLVVCYKATSEEIKKYNLTSENIILFIKHDEIKHLSSTNISYKNLLKKVFKNQSILVRIQSECLLGMYGDSHCDCEKQRLKAIELITKNNGIFIHMPQEAQGWGLFYKLKELELQMSGKTQDGNYVGIKNRDEAQKILLGNKSFKDNRNYEIIAQILMLLGLEKNKIVLMSDSKNKIQNLKNSGLDVLSYEEYKDKVVNEDNLSEYLVKILNNTHEYSQETLDEILLKINNRQHNERTLSTLVNIVNKIKNDKNYKLDKVSKQKILNTYNNIICGEEKQYYVGEENDIKIQNNFSCRVNTSIFKVIKKIYNKNVFERISLEKLYYFQNKNSNEIVKIRTSEILDIRDEESVFFKGQHHAEQRTIDKDKNVVIQSEVTVSRLRSYFENPNYDYVKTVEMVTTISESEIPDVKIFIKRIPTIENRVLDIFGKKEDIKELLDKIMGYGKNVLLNSVSNAEYEDENFTDYNLRFADIKGIIDEELDIFNLIR